MVMDGYGWLWMVMDGYGWLWMVMDGYDFFLCFQLACDFSLVITARLCANAQFQEEPVVADQVLKDSLEKIADSGLVAKSSTAQSVD